MTMTPMIGEGFERPGDGRYLHIVGNSGTTVRRFDTLSRTIDLSWTNSGYTVEDIAVQPGNPNVVAVAWYQPGWSPAGRGVVLYEGGVARTNSVSGNQIAFGESPDRLYTYVNDYPVSFNLVKAGASGLAQESTLPILTGWTEEFTCGGGMLFSRNGPAYDPETGVLLTGSSAGWTAPVDKAAGRFFTVEAEVNIETGIHLLPESVFVAGPDLLQPVQHLVDFCEKRSLGGLVGRRRRGNNHR